MIHAGMWPSNDPGKVSHKPWLANFSESEAHIAAALLDIFVYFSDQQVTQLLRRSLRMLMQRFGGNDVSITNKKSLIYDRLARTIFVPVEGERPNPTDSGNFICRLVRQTLEIPESQVNAPDSALQQYVNDGKTIVFVDDIVGTGNQMSAAWVRDYGSIVPKSFREAHIQTNRQCYYLCLACTEGGRSALEFLSGIEVVAAHDLEERDRFDTALRRIPDHPSGDVLQDNVEDLLKKYGFDLDLNGYMKQQTFPIFGFENLGLTIAFQHSIPDTTLPIYWADGVGDWMPLSKRS